MHSIGALALPWCALGSYPTIWNIDILLNLSPCDIFILVFSPHNFSSLRFLEGIFSVDMLATYPK